MAINKAIIQGRIPFDLEIKNGDDDKKAFLGFSVSVRRSYKPEGEEFYPEDLIYCKAFGTNAKFINNYFSKGSNLILEGELRMDDDYEKDGQTVKGRMYFHVVPGGVHFQNGNAKSEGESAPAKSTFAPKKAAPAAASAPAKKLNPLAKKRVI